jgi:hypothetical protein
MDSLVLVVVDVKLKRKIVFGSDNSLGLLG